MPKVWEARVRILLEGREILWHYKAPDSQGYGGKPRIDFVACDILGRFLGIEVKSLPDTRKSFTIDKEVPAVQRDILTRIGSSANGCAILAVGSGTDVLYLYNWRKICQQTRVNLDSGAEFHRLAWSGPTCWKQDYNLYKILVKSWRYEPSFWSGLPLPMGSTSPLPPPPPPSPPPPLAFNPVLVAHTMAEVMATPSPSSSLSPNAPPSQGAERPAIVVTPATSPPLKKLAERLETLAASVSATTTTSEPSGGPSPDTAPSPSTSKSSEKQDSLSTRRKKLLSQKMKRRAGPG